MINSSNNNQIKSKHKTSNTQNLSICNIVADIKKLQSQYNIFYNETKKILYNEKFQLKNKKLNVNYNPKKHVPLMVLSII